MDQKNKSIQNKFKSCLYDEFKNQELQNSDEEKTERKYHYDQSQNLNNSNREKIAERKKKHYEANREKIAERKKKYYEANREKIAGKTNREKIAERKKKHYEANRGKIAEKHKKYYEANRGKIAEKSKKQIKENRGKIAEKLKNYYELNRGKIAEKLKNYYELNRGKILEKKKKNYEANREKIAEKRKKQIKENRDKCFLKGDKQEKYNQDKDSATKQINKEDYIKANNTLKPGAAIHKMLNIESLCRKYYNDNKYDSKQYTLRKRYGTIVNNIVKVNHTSTDEFEGINTPSYSDKSGSLNYTQTMSNISRLNMELDKKCELTAKVQGERAVRDPIQIQSKKIINDQSKPRRREFKDDEAPKTPNNKIEVSMVNNKQIEMLNQLEQRIKNEDLDSKQVKWIQREKNISIKK